MKISQRLAATILLALLVATPALGQGTGAQMQRFSDGGVSFQYPTQWKLTDKSTQNNQHLVLELNGTSAQIMVLVERTPSTQPGQRTATLQARSAAFADIMTKELEKTGTTVQRSEVTTDVGGVAADGLRLRAAPGNQPGSIEVYSFVLSGRIVMLTLLRPDRDAQAAAPAWTAVRSSLRVGAAAQTTAQQDLRLVDERTVITPRPAESVSSTQPSNRFAGLDYGSVTGSSYANKFFGFRLTIPYGWRVQGQEVKELLSETGRETVKTGDARKDSQMESSFNNTVNLLTVFKYDVGAATAFNSSVICGAELLPRSMTANQYLLNAKMVLETSAKQGQYLFKPFATETVGGEGFSVMEIETAALRQKYYVSIKKGYALFFILTYESDEDEAVLRQLMRSVRFS